MSSEESEDDSAVESEEEDEEEVEPPKLELPSRATRGMRMNKVGRLVAHVLYALTEV